MYLARMAGPASVELNVMRDLFGSVFGSFDGLEASVD